MAEIAKPRTSAHQTSQAMSTAFHRPSPTLAITSATRRSAPAHEPPDGGHHLVGAIDALLALGAHDAMARVVVEQAERDLVERGLDRADLGEHVDAVAVVLDHALDAADLALDAPQALEELVLGGGVAVGLVWP